MLAKKKKFGYKAIPINQTLENSRENCTSKNIHLTEKLTFELNELYEQIKLSKKEFEIRNEIFQKIKNAIENELNANAMEKAVVKAYGSFQTKMMVYNSDIDITVIKKGIEDSKMSVNQFLRKIENIIYKYDLSSGAVLHIKNAKTPILKFFDCKYGIKIDISINKDDGIETGNFVIEKIKKIKNIEIMIILLKYFLKRRRLSETMNGGLCAYGQFILILNFIQLHPLVQSESISIKENLGVLFLDFFQYYSKFPFESAKIDINNVRYLENPRYGIFLVDPVYDEERNIAAGTTNIGHVIDVFRFSYRLMSSAINQRIDSKKCIVDLWIRVDSGEIEKRKKMCNEE